MTIESLDMEFEENCIMAITGQNGAGKSSLLYAIALCLINYRQGDSYKDYVLIGEDYSIIQLKAFFKGKPILYEVEITGAEKKTSAALKRKVTYDGIEYLNSDYSQFLEKYELEDLESLMFMFQGSKDIIETRPAERAAMLKKLFRFEFTDIVDKLKEEQEQLKTEEVQYNAVARELEGRSFERQNLLREKLPSVIEEWENRISEISTSLDQLKDINDDSLVNCESEISSVQRKINAEISKIEGNKTLIRSTEDKLKIVIKYLEDTDENDLNDSLDEAKNKLTQHQEDYENQRTLYNKKTSELNVLSFRLKDLEGQIEISKKGVCHACGQPITQEHIDNLLNNKTLLEEDIKNKKDEISSLNFDSKDLESIVLRTGISEIEEDIRKYKEAIKNKSFYEKQLSDTRDVLSYAETYLTSLYENKNKLLEEQNRLNELKPLLQQKNELLQEKENLASEVSSAKEISSINQERKKRNEFLEQEEKERDEKLEEYSKKINDVTLALASGKTMIDIFSNKFPTYITLQACIQLENYVNEIIQTVFPLCRVSLRLNRGGVNFFYTPDITKDKWISVAMASGAQKDVLSLAYKISLARMYNISCLCLDEIDAACSDENANIIYRFIVSLNCFDQILFISHRQESIKAVRSLNPNALIYAVENGEYELVE